MYKTTKQLTREERIEVSELVGKIMLGVLENKSSRDIAAETGLNTWEVEANINTTLYTLCKRVGPWRYLRNIKITKFNIK